MDFGEGQTRYQAHQEGESLESGYTGQGTRLSEKAPWETYAAEMDTPMTPELAAAVAEYAESRYDDSLSSNQSKEELHRQRELNEGVAKEYQFLTPEEYADLEQRVGKVMHAAVFLNKLQEGGLHCWYGEHPQQDKCVLWVSKDRGIGEPENICWVQRGYMPELSFMNFDEHGVPLAEKRRGWRTCLLQMILKETVTEEQANNLFGPPKQTEAFHRYNSTLYEWRNRKFTVE